VRTVEDWARYDPHARNASLWITLVIAALSIAIVAVIILGPRYTKRCLQAIRRSAGGGRWEEGIDRPAWDDNTRYLYGEWDPTTTTAPESEHTTPSAGVTINTIGLVMSTYVTGAAVGSTYDHVTACHDDVIDDGVFDDGDGDLDAALPTFRSEPEMMGYHVTADVTEISMPDDDDDDSSEFEQTEGSEECDDNGFVGNDDDVDDMSQRENRNSNDVTGERPGAGIDELDDATRSEPRTGNSSLDACVCTASDAENTDWSCQAERCRGVSVTSQCEENVLPP